MKRPLRNTLALLAVAGFTAAAVTPAFALNLRGRDRVIIYENFIAAAPVPAPPPAGWVAEVGVPVPPDVELYPAPDIAAVPEIGDYRYTVVDDDVVLVDPETSTVVDVIARY